LNKKFRLSKTSDFQRVRKNGNSYSNPLVVLIAQENGSTHTKIAVSASRSVGNAVQRNRVKRKIREAMRTFLTQITPGWDIVILSRQRMTSASLDETKEALDHVLCRAGLKCI